MVEAGIRDDLPAIVEILNYAIMNSNATLTAQPTSAAERLEWFERFSADGPSRLLVARRGSQVLGYAASQPYRDHEGFRETVEVSIALAAGSRGQGIGTRCIAHRPSSGAAQRRRCCAAPGPGVSAGLSLGEARPAHAGPHALTPQIELAHPLRESGCM